MGESSLFWELTPSFDLPQFTVFVQGRLLEIKALFLLWGLRDLLFVYPSGICHVMLLEDSGPGLSKLNRTSYLWYRNQRSGKPPQKSTPMKNPPRNFRCQRFRVVF